LTETQREASSGLVGTADEIARIARTNASGTREASTATDEQMRTMQQITGAARDLARSSESLRDLIARFRLE
jgi:methyl-accepting chemotaxis protein